ncbi:MAG: O-antigen ligase family protein [Candidatus Kerfeldbacteria bacterium]|nr:O-antigen ligase family protein [Candidatus Kerfeldbacteria bacterium]
MLEQQPYRLAAVLAVGVAMFAGVLVGADPLLGGLLITGSLLGIAVVRWPLVGLAGLVASLVIGQLVRVPVFGGAGAVLPNDVLLPAVVVGWLMRGLLRGRLGWPSSPLSWPIATMLVVFILTFIAGTAQLPFLTDRERLVAALYVVRWAEYAVLLLIVADLIRRERDARRLTWWLISAAAVIAVLGFVQLKLFPDFSFMVPQGWDPHIGRLLSTWFDPNFLAGFFAFTTMLVGGIALHSTGRRRLVLAVVTAVLFAAVVLTFSRSGYLSFLAGAVVLTFLKSRRLFVLLVLAAVIVVATIPRVQERVQGAIKVDATARLRLVSWQHALTVYRDYPVTGIGYNTYRYLQVDYGFIKDAAEHSAGGSDSSLLTVLVTTGPIGLVVYLWLLWAAAGVGWRAFRRGLTGFERGLGLGALAGLVSVTVHSFFVNSLLFPHIMETLALTFGTLVGLRSVSAREAT